MIDSNQIFAHSLPDDPDRSHWETLPAHSQAVAALAREFCHAFAAADWGELLGRWHDLGKASEEFQRYIRQSSNSDDASEETTQGRVDHSTFGARHACAVLSRPKIFGQMLAFCIAGHHAGLTDAHADDDSSQRRALATRLDPSKYNIPAVSISEEPRVTLNIPIKAPAEDPTGAAMGFTLAFFTRMLFSALVDADRTATEQFCDPDQAKQRMRAKPALAELREAVDRFLDEKQAGASGPVNAIRADVLKRCLEASSKSPGFFSLNVPTGGGKTFSSLAFALHHARHHPHLRRVVVAIPFTSIIEQTADQYRSALKSLAGTALVEHHSNLHPKTDTRQNRLATENWDAPLIVTTNVQLFESMFASAGTPCRKLHRLANSIIILDEAQTIPIDLLKPTLAALNELVVRYGCTVVLCTATQPALEHRPDFSIGLQNVREIIEDAPALHRSLRRVEVIRAGRLEDEELAQRLLLEEQALCVVNTKAHAAKLYQLLTDQLPAKAGCYHLSTFMCAQHRRDVLSKIRSRLKEQLPCRIISTQLIEAGVDIDLPVVYRASAGFDSLAQAAGRCNREGRLLDQAGNPLLGKVYAFDTSQLPPPGLLRIAAQTAAELAPDHPDPLAPLAVEAYFKLLYWSRSHEWDKHEVMPCFNYNPRLKEHDALAPFQFRTAAQNYQIIRDQQTPILVPYDDQAAEMIAHVVANKPIDLQLIRKSQQYTVSVHDHFLKKLQANAALHQHESGLLALTNPAGYSAEQGMLPNVVGLSPETLMV